MTTGLIQLPSTLDYSFISSMADGPSLGDIGSWALDQIQWSSSFHWPTCAADKKSLVAKISHQGYLNNKHQPKIILHR